MKTAKAGSSSPEIDDTSVESQSTEVDSISDKNQEPKSIGGFSGENQELQSIEEDDTFSGRNQEFQSTGDFSGEKQEHLSSEGDLFSNKNELKNNSSLNENHNSGIELLKYINNDGND